MKAKINWILIVTAIGVAVSYAATMLLILNREFLCAIPVAFMAIGMGLLYIENSPCKLKPANPGRKRASDGWLL